MLKRLDRFVLKSFLPMFAMTFFIVLFIVLMQFLWMHMDDLIGKGLSVSVLGELFFYAALTMTPMALPLAILLASLMSFGNLGEKSELTAIKASGVSLLRVMAPLIVLISFIAVGAFFFQNNVLPKAQVKMWTLLFSARQKSPELEIPEGSFYDQITGYNLYVKSKNRETGMLYNTMIYDLSHGDNSTILLADSARLAFTPDMQYLYLHLWSGEQFENLRGQNSNSRNIPFRRESFADKELLIPFDANFNRLNEEGMRSQYVGKNISELRHSIDSLTRHIDSISTRNADGFQTQVFPVMSMSLVNTEQNDTLWTRAEKNSLSLDSMLLALTPAQRDGVFNAAYNLQQQRKGEQEFRAVQMKDEKLRLRRHHIELIKKFTLSVACIIFLFIGAPLGAIIRKGGLGAPMVISIMLFLIYYIIDNTGFKMAREGIWQPWAGMWLSTFILLPLGIFVTWKAMNDSAVFNADLYKEWFRCLLGLPEQRQITKKEVIINDLDPSLVNKGLAYLIRRSDAWLNVHKRRQSYRRYWMEPYRRHPIAVLGHRTDEFVKYMSDSRDLKIIDMLNHYPVLEWLWIYCPFRSLKVRKILMWFAPAGIIFYLVSLPYTHRLNDEVRRIGDTSRRLDAYLNPKPEDAEETDPAEEKEKSEAENASEN